MNNTADDSTNPYPSVSRYLKHAIKDCTELLGNEVLYDMTNRLHRDIGQIPVDASALTSECLRYSYRLLFLMLINSNSEIERYSVSEPGDGFSLHEALSRIFLKFETRLFSPENTPVLNAARLRNFVLSKAIRLLRPNHRRPGYDITTEHIGEAYESLLSYKGFITPKLKENFIYRPAGNGRGKSASYYTPGTLTETLVKYALDELLRNKTSDEILELTVCEPAVGNAAFINETIDQLAEAYLQKRQNETGTIIANCDIINEKRKIKQLVAERNVYGVDLDPMALELAEASIIINTAYDEIPSNKLNQRFKNGNSLIGARRDVYKASQLTPDADSNWYENTPEFLPFSLERHNGQIWHFLLGDPKMACYTDSAVKKLQPEAVKKIRRWNKEFISPYSGKEINELRRLSSIIDALWKDNRLYDSSSDSYMKLKFIMDYWCALWFWPVSEADALPCRNEFIKDISSILEDDYNEPLNPRFQLVRNIVRKKRFLHWELEFAEVFKKRGGFDLVIGNPPWIKLGWSEQTLLADLAPAFSMKKLSHTETAALMSSVLKTQDAKNCYLSEYVSVAGEQNFLNAAQNYPELQSMKANLYKCFLPLSWRLANPDGICAFIHPEGVFDDPKGGLLREKMYPRLRKHFTFINEFKLFKEVHHNTQYSLNVYGCPQAVSFDFISRLYSPETIKECYEGNESDLLPEMKNEIGKWNTKGHPDRIIHITENELSVFSKLFDNSINPKQARLPALYAKGLIGVLHSFANQQTLLEDIPERVFISQMWEETTARKNGIIVRKPHFPKSTHELVYSGPNVGVANPLYKASRRECQLNCDYDNIDLRIIPEDYLQRCSYAPSANTAKYLESVPVTPWNTKYTDEYRIYMRKMLNIFSERTLTGGIALPGTSHTNGILGFAFKNSQELLLVAAEFASLPFDFFIKATGKPNLYNENANRLPIIHSKYDSRLILRALLLNSVTRQYSELWETNFSNEMALDSWAKNDSRLDNRKFKLLSPKWNYGTPFRSDYERRQALVETDVLTAMAIGLNLEQLKAIYRIQFPILKSYEANTWYDIHGRIVYTNNRGLASVGFPKDIWENDIKYAKAGETFRRTFTDDTVPDGPVERTVEYTAPFDICDREHDYETAWDFFLSKINE